jgi:hypothetical protein
VGYLRFDTFNKFSGKCYESEIFISDIASARERVKKLKSFETSAVSVSNFRFKEMGKKERRILKV